MHTICQPLANAVDLCRANALLGIALWLRLAAIVWIAVCIWIFVRIRRYWAAGAAKLATGRALQRGVVAHQNCKCNARGHILGS